MNDGVSPAEIMKHLKGIDFPASRSDIISYARGNEGSDRVLSVLDQIEDKEYESPADLMKAIGKIE